MSDEFQITDYNVALLLALEHGPGNISGELREIEAIMTNPRPVALEAEDVNRLEFLSASDQLVLQIHPPNATLWDVSGKGPAQEAFAKGLDGLLSLLKRHSISIPAFGWNINGVLPEAVPAQVIGNLFDISRVDRVLGGEVEPSWTVPEINIGFWFGTDPSDFRTLTLRQDPQEGSPMPIEFTFNATFGEPLEGTIGTLEQGESIGREMAEILDRLTTAKEGD
ncbi:MAG: hypothetical protein F4Y69_06250 [Chloroflexi bacterium]|nr:hypothetical protein [Chloroflexota bacterium]MYD15999.1 hypothetical protein [Chloroflexota bacterium]MYG34638.1 hypothetical protein [Gemmatimonadota bacterium]